MVCEPKHSELDKGTTVTLQYVLECFRDWQEAQKALDNSRFGPGHNRDMLSEHRDNCQESYERAVNEYDMTHPAQEN